MKEKIIYQPNPYFRLLNGDIVPLSDFENNTLFQIISVEKMIKDGDVIGQRYFDVRGRVDTLLWMPLKVLNHLEGWEAMI